ncbi:hypothetical protein [Streptomyces sp. HB132]|uniref:hypothetical protein n=1 Tax=Streptomyces sp. HB132 TaxID=767388 RepID=UPI001960B301|nr:hypothetical protein [Streptomyces sp. HB132]MBM7443069.1 hypothetical protein [Streptomyces sp. HB132]
MTSQGTARAARIQAETTAAVQRADQRRTARRTAYADVIEQAQKIGDLYWKVNDAHADPDPESRTATLKRPSATAARRIRNAAPSRTSGGAGRGPQEAAAAADRLRRSTSGSYQALEDLIRGEADAIQRFNECYAPFWERVVALVAIARDVLQEGAVPALVPAPALLARQRWVRHRPRAGE